MTLYEIKRWRYICNICGVSSRYIDSPYKPPYPTGWGPVKVVARDNSENIVLENTITACHNCYHKELPWPLEEAINQQHAGWCGLVTKKSYVCTCGIDKLEPMRWTRD